MLSYICNINFSFKVVAVNAVGKGPASIASNVVRTEKTKLKQVNLVESFTLSSVSSDSIKVKWSMPEDRNTALSGYKIVYRNEDKLEQPKSVFLFFLSYSPTEQI